MEGEGEGVTGECVRQGQGGRAIGGGGVRSAAQRWQGAGTAGCYYALPRGQAEEEEEEEGVP